MPQHQIPKNLSHAEVLNALKPLMDLLGTSSECVYSSSPIVIDLGGSIDGEIGTICFAVAAGELNERGRASGVPAAGHPQGQELAEAAYMVRVAVTGFGA